jgi:hypothetical protein
MRRTLAAVVVSGLLVAWTGRAEAQCTQNADCRGGRVCANGSCVAAPPVSTGPLTCTRDRDCPAEAICEGGICIAAPVPGTPPVQPPPPVYVQQPPPVQPVYAPSATSADSYVPTSIPWILQINLGFGAMFSGLGAGLEFGYAGEYIGGTGFFNVGYGFGVGSGSSFGYGGGARFLAGHNPHFGYLGIAYTLVATAGVSDVYGYGSTEDIWGPSLLFGYQYTSAMFRFFADIGFSWVSDPWDGMYYVEGLDSAVFTFDLGIGWDCLGWEI